jgi:uncharacterized membrane protein HdeD (DUF308 family)
MKTNSKGVLVISIILIIGTPIWLFLVGNTAMGIMWLCVGIIALISALIRRKKEKNK